MQATAKVGCGLAALVFVFSVGRFWKPSRTRMTGRSGGLQMAFGGGVPPTSKGTTIDIPHHWWQMLSLR